MNMNNRKTFVSSVISFFILVLSLILITFYHVYHGLDPRYRSKPEADKINLIVHFPIIQLIKQQDGNGILIPFLVAVDDSGLEQSSGFNAYWRVVTEKNKNNKAQDWYLGSTKRGNYTKELIIGSYRRRYDFKILYSQIYQELQITQKVNKYIPCRLQYYFEARTTNCEEIQSLPKKGLDRPFQIIINIPSPD